MNNYPTDLTYPFKIADLLSFSELKESSFEKSLLNIQFNNTALEILPATSFILEKKDYLDFSDDRKKLIFAGVCNSFQF